MEKTEVKAAMVERYPDPNIEDPQLYDKLLTLPGHQVRCTESWNVGDGIGNGNGNGNDQSHVNVCGDNISSDCLKISNCTVYTSQVVDLAWVQKHVWSKAVSLDVPREGVVRGMQVR